MSVFRIDCKVSFVTQTQLALLVIVTARPNVTLGSLLFSACPELLGSSIGTEQSEAFNDLKGEFCSLEH